MSRFNSVAVLEEGYIQKYVPKDVSYDTMEEELTCPVCLELYADPLMLPCSHSICKKCLMDILTSRVNSRKDGMDCPSCRKTHAISREKISRLPRNLALENIVIRFQEIQCSSITKSKSLDLSMDMQLFSPTEKKDLDLPVFVESNKEDCGLCDGKQLGRAVWFCQQCAVHYCQSCLDKFHPKRGSLMHHKITKPRKSTSDERPTFCKDHETEVATIFCDQCKGLVCHFCVCDGVGKHSGHKILSQETAWQQIMNTASSTKDDLDGMLTTMSNRNHQLDEVLTDLETLYRQSSQKLEIQYRRLVDDLTTSIKYQKQVILNNLAESRTQMVSRIRSHIDENKKHTRQLEVLTEGCKKVLDQDQVKEVLDCGADIEPILQKVQHLSKTIKDTETSYTDVVNEKTTQYEMQSSLKQFRKMSHRCTMILLDDDEEKCQSMIPIMRSPTSPGKADAPRVQNKCLITWGFMSTTFTAEPLMQNSYWSVSIEKNTSHLGDIKMGYLFGLGISSETLNFKDLVGMNSKSYGVACSGGNLVFCHNSKVEPLMPLENLPLSISVYVTIDNEEQVTFSYRLTNKIWGDILHGKKVIHDRSLQKAVLPVFCVSQRVKMQFPTFV